MKTNRKKSFSYLLFFLLLLVFLALFAFLGIRSFYRANYMPEPCTESADELSNPYIGFYHMYGYVLGSDSLSNLPAASDSDAKNRQGIVMLEVNLQNFSNEDLSDSALSQLDTILSAWQRHGSQVILRFLYDWDGKAMETEPQSLEQILRHMDQTAEVVNRYTDCVFLMQGIFVGNCGEMNNSHYMSDEDCTTLMHHLAEVTDPSVFLSVRTPVQRRKILDSSERPTKETAFDGSLSSRLGLFNDGMLGTANDTGTYGDTAASADTYRSAWVREDELSFQNELCNFVPNGGEVTLDNPLNDLAHAIQDLSRMHVSYLNSEHDPAVLDKWKAAAYKDKASVFNGLSGYDYIALDYVLSDLAAIMDSDKFAGVNISSVIWDTAMSSRTLLWIRLIFRYGWKMLVFLSAIENWIYSSPWFLPMVRFSHFPSLRIPDSGYRGLLQSSLFLSRLRDSPKAVIRYISR